MPQYGRKLKNKFKGKNKSKFKISFQDCFSPLCFCVNDIETYTYWLVHCTVYTNERMNLLDKIKRMTCDILELSDAIMTKILFVGDDSLSASFNTLILKSMINNVNRFNRFDHQ